MSHRFDLYTSVYNFDDFKSHYNKTKISEMDISNICLKNESFEIFA